MPPGWPASGGGPPFDPFMPFGGGRRGRSPEGPVMPPGCPAPGGPALGPVIPPGFPASDGGPPFGPFMPFGGGRRGRSPVGPVISPGCPGGPPLGPVMPPGPAPGPASGAGLPWNLARASGAATVALLKRCMGGRPAFGGGTRVDSFATIRSGGGGALLAMPLPRGASARIRIWTRCPTATVATRLGWRMTLAARTIGIGRPVARSTMRMSTLRLTT